MSDSPPKPAQDGSKSGEANPSEPGPAEAKPSTETAAPVEAEPTSDAGPPHPQPPPPPKGTGEDEPAKRKRKKRKRKRKKKPDPDAEPVAASLAEHAGDDAAPGGSDTKRTKEKRAEPPPFQHLFKTPAPAESTRDPASHASQASEEDAPPPAQSQAQTFKVGSLVAGHVVFAGEGAAVINLYGKGTAFVLENEPREIPTLVLPEPPASSEGGPEQEPGATTAPPKSAEGNEPHAPADAPQTGPASASPADQSGSGAQFSLGALPEIQPDQPVAPAQPAVGTDGKAESAATADPPPEPDSDADADEPAVLEPESPESELHDTDLHEPAEPELEALPPLELGQLFRGRVGAVAESGHVALVNRNIDPVKAREKLKKAKNARQRVQGLVFGYNRGGFDVLVEGLRAYCPVRGLSLDKNLSDPVPFLGRVVEFQVQAAKSGKHGIVVSRRTLLEREAKKAARQRLKQLVVGDVLEGRVTRVFEFGVIVDLGASVEGMVHKTELSWEHGVKPGDAAKVGDTVEVKVLEISIPSREKPPKKTKKKKTGTAAGGIEASPEGAEPETGDADVAAESPEESSTTAPAKSSKRSRADSKTPKKRRSSISLSIKALQPDPWQELVKQLRPGTAVKGTVASTADFGAFIELAPNVQGLLHISELRKPEDEEPLEHAKEVLSNGEEVVVVVERAERDRRRISLSLLDPADVAAFEAGTLDDSGDAKKIRPGGQAKVRVVSADKRGVRVRVAGVLGRRGRGFIRPGDTGTHRGTDLRKKFRAGTEIDVKVVGTDRDGSLRCSIKALAHDEERQAIKAYKKKAQKESFGTLGDLFRDKLGDH